MEKGQKHGTTTRHQREGEQYYGPFAVLVTWMAANVAAIARQWDSGPGRASWQRYSQKHQGAPTESVRSAWLQEVRGPAVRNWTLAAAIEQGIVSHHTAMLYAMSEGIAGLPRSPEVVWAA